MSDLELVKQIVEFLEGYTDADPVVDPIVEDIYNEPYDEEYDKEAEKLREIGWLAIDGEWETTYVKDSIRVLMYFNKEEEFLDAIEYLLVNVYIDDKQEGETIRIDNTYESVTGFLGGLS